MSRKPKIYTLIHCFAIFYVGLVATSSASLWLSEGEGLHALTCLGAQACAIFMALICREALIQRKWMTGIAAFALSSFAATWAGLGIQHAWEASSEPLPEAMYYGFAAFEPLLFLIVEHVKGGHGSDGSDDGNFAVVTPASRRSGSRNRGKGLLSLILPLATVSALTPTLEWEGAAIKPASAVDGTDYALLRQRTLDAIRRNPGMSDARIAKKVGAALSTVGKWRRDAVAAGLL